MILPRTTLSQLLRSRLPVDAMAAVELALEVAAHHLPGSTPGNQLAAIWRVNLPAGSTDPRVILHAWHVEKLTDMLITTPEGTPQNAALRTELERSADLLATARLALPPVGTTLKS